MQNFDGCKIWIGDDRELSAKIQDAAFKAGWTWGRSFGGTVLKPGKIRFIKFESYGGEKRIFSGHSGESNREGFDSCPSREIYASEMGIIHHSGQCNLEDPDWLPSRGDKVKLLRYESIDEYETTKMKEKLAIGAVYEVLESDVNFRSADGRKCIRLVEVNQWYLLSAFTKWVAGDGSSYRPPTEEDFQEEKKTETVRITGSRFPTLPKKGDYIILNSTSSTRIFDGASADAMEKEMTIGRSYEIMGIDPHWSIMGDDNSPSVRIKYDSGSDSSWCSLADFIPSVTERFITVDIETTPSRIYVEVTRNTKIKIGDTLRITDRPLTWNSLFSNKSPMDRHINYPMEVVVEKYSDSYGGTFLAGGFGWCLEGLIKKGCVKLIENPVAGLISTHFSDALGMVQTLGRTARQDPTNIKVEGVTKAAPVSSRVTVSPLKMVNVPLAFPIKTKTIDRVTTKSNPIQI